MATNTKENRICCTQCIKITKNTSSIILFEFSRSPFSNIFCQLLIICKNHKNDIKSIITKMTVIQTVECLVDLRKSFRNCPIICYPIPAFRSNHLLELVDISHHQGHIDQATNVVSSTGRRNQFMDWKIATRRERIGNRFVLCHFRWSTENKHLKT